MNETPSTTSTIATPTTVAGEGAAAATAQDMINRAAATAHQAVDRMAAAAGPAVERLRAGASSMAESVKARADQIGAAEEQWIASARDIVRQHPLAAVAVGVLVGVLVGKLTSGSDD